jgi:hypothetical protein
MGVAAGAVPALAAEVQYPAGNSIGVVPPPGLRAIGNGPGFHDPAHHVTMLLLELPRGAYNQLESSLTTDAAKQHGIVIDHRETLFTDAGAATVSAGTDPQQHVRKWMMVALLPTLTAVVSVQIPEAARDRYPDSAIRASLASLTARPPPVKELIELLPYKLADLSGLRIVTIVNRNTVILTDGPNDDLGAIDQPHLVIGIAAASAKAGDRARLAQVAFANIPGFVDRRVTVSEMLRVDGQAVHEIRAEARDARSGRPVTLVQWLRFGQSAYVHIVGVTEKENWARDFPRFRAVRDGIEPRKR